MFSGIDEHNIRLRAHWAKFATIHFFTRSYPRLPVETRKPPSLLSISNGGMGDKIYKANGSYFRDGWARMRQAAPLLYVFYRDGTIFYIPLCALSIFGFAATLTRLTREFTCSNWEAWLGITYYIVGTRLILNIRQAGLKFSTSMFTGQGQELSSLVFSPDRESTMEGDVSTMESPQTTSTVEIIEISRTTKDGSSNG
ncbi:hypothetical protein Agabi119p4_7922 [Agaricus bisporus var. burnettii]|uniref:Uncharacterized protein n=1 Tax=Agaricus bisporus var. burnettii TaxID=192524 RepID=A0A8H7EZE1_AGABI|nr:hypothetical protein Agabi119p4_7922 [Agaricus bisporus var. burnettii]